MLGGSPSNHFTAVDAAATLFSSTAPLDWLGWPGMADLGTHWALSYQQREQHQVAGTGSGHRLRFSDDEGATWTDDRKFTDGDDVTGLPDHVGSPYMIVTTSGDLIMLTTDDGTMYTRPEKVYRSTDGGKTWTSAASGIADWDVMMQAGFGCVHDGVIYVPMHKFSDASIAKPWGQEVWSSSDNGATWALRGTVPYGEAESGNEFSIMQTSGTNMIAICRDNANEKTYINRSADLGATWGARQIISDMGIMQMGRMRKYADGIMLFGREGSKTNGSVYTTVWHSTDGEAWGRKFRPDTQNFSDGAYCDVLERTNGVFYCVTYGGNDGAANIRAATFEVS